MQTTLLSIAIALILALLAALVGPHVIRWNDHRAFFEAEASRLIGIKVRVGGDIDAALLPFPSVTLRAIAIGPAGEGSRMRARSLRIELALGPLMRGEVRATEMKLVAPQFNIGLDEQRPDRLAAAGAWRRDAVDRPFERRGWPGNADRCGRAGRSSCSISCGSPARCARSPARSGARASSSPAAGSTATRFPPAAPDPRAPG